MPSKLGIHSILQDDTVNVVQELAAAGARMPTVKAVEAIDWLSQVKAVDPKIITMGRFIKGADGMSVEAPSLEGNLRKTAQDVMVQLFPKWERHRSYVDYWEIINEMDPPTVDGHRRLAELMIHMMDLAEPEGYKVALFSYSLGVPEWEEIKAIVGTGVFGRAKAGGHVLALHEYAFPIDKWYGDSLPGQPAYPNRGPLSCRYRWWYEDFLKPRDEVVPLYITEVNLATNSRLLEPAEWIRQMAWYDARLREDYYVVGAHIFTMGAPNQDWDDYKFKRMLPLLKAHIVSLKGTTDPEWPEEEEGEPPETPGGPREPYDRHYLLLPPDAGWAWVAACQAYWETFKVTIGGSADDAGYGPGLKSRAVTAVNPERWPGDLAAFFNAHYPGVRYDPITAVTPAALAQQLGQRVAAGKRFG